MDRQAMEKKLAELGYMRCDDGFCDMNGCAIYKASEYRDLSEALYEALGRLMVEQEWVKVNERLPEIGTRVFALKERSGVVVVDYSEESHKHRTLIRTDGQWWDCGERITHWREITLPEGEKE